MAVVDQLRELIQAYLLVESSATKCHLRPGTRSRSCSRV